MDFSNLNASLVTIQVLFLIAFYVYFFIKETNNGNNSALEVALSKSLASIGIPVALLLIIYALSPELLKGADQLLRVYIALGGLSLGGVTINTLRSHFSINSNNQTVDVTGDVPAPQGKEINNSLDEDKTTTDNRTL